jgi:hypothetical protein
LGHDAWVSLTTEEYVSSGQRGEVRAGDREPVTYSLIIDNILFGERRFLPLFLRHD